MSEIPRSVLDLEVIESLRMLGGEDDPDLLQDLVEIFLEQTPALIARLQEAFDSNDAHALERAAHSLKSSCANLGALRLSAHFKEMELAGRSKDIERVRPLLVESEREYTEVESALKRLL
jgi:HPt (histidine-containing phosphotransfer) domain-containing protein